MKKLILIFALLFSFTAFAKDDEPSKTDEALAKVVERALEVAEQTGNFVIEQAPDLLQEFYAWHIGSSIFWGIFGILLMIIGRHLPKLWLTKVEKGDKGGFFNYSEGYGDGEMPAWIFFTFANLIGFLTVISNIYDLVFISVAPKLYLIEYFLNR